MKLSLPICFILGTLGATAALPTDGAGSFSAPSASGPGMDPHQGFTQIYAAGPEIAARGGVASPSTEYIDLDGDDGWNDTVDLGSAYHLEKRAARAFMRGAQGWFTDLVKMTPEFVNQYMTHKEGADRVKNAPRPQARVPPGVKTTKAGKRMINIALKSYEEHVCKEGTCYHAVHPEMGVCVGVSGDCSKVIAMLKKNKESKLQAAESKVDRAKKLNKSGVKKGKSGAPAKSGNRWGTKPKKSTAKANGGVKGANGVSATKGQKGASAANKATPARVVQKAGKNGSKSRPARGARRGGAKKGKAARPGRVKRPARPSRGKRT